MANSDHIKWLREGVDAWNKRRMQDDFIPDLGFANLGDADLRDANLWGANLRDANLRDANLRDSDLRDSDLRDANLWGANLRDADLGFANLGDADLGGADIRTVYSGVGTNDFSTPEYSDLSEVKALSQAQLNTMRGDRGVILPEGLEYPAHWPEPEPPETTDPSSQALTVEQKYLAIEAPIDIVWTEEGQLHANYLVAINPAPRQTLPAVSEDSQIQQLAAVGQVAGQIKASLRKNSHGNANSIVGDISDVFAAIEAEVSKPEGLVLIVVVKANILALERLAIHREALSLVDQALFDAFMGEAKILLSLYPILGRIEDPHHAGLVPPENLDAAMEATDHLIEVLTSEETESAIGPSLPGVTRDLATYPWDSDRKRVAVFAALGTRLKAALENPPPWVDGAAKYSAIIGVVIALIAALA